MDATTYPYQPDCAVPPGWVVEEHLQSQIFPRLSLPAVPFRRNSSGEIITASSIDPGPLYNSRKKCLAFDCGHLLGIEPATSFTGTKVEPREQRITSWVRSSF